MGQHPNQSLAIPMKFVDGAVAKTIQAVDVVMAPENKLEGLIGIAQV